MHIFTSRLVIVIFSVLLSMPLIAFASGFQNPLALQFIVNILRGFILAVIYVGTPALAVLIAWTGFLFVTAQGNPDGIKKAKEMLIRVVVAGIILLSLWAIVRLVGNTLAGLSTASLLIILSGFYLYVISKKD